MLSKVEEFLDSQSRWRELFIKLREIILACDLEEEFKWKHPCYTLNKKNVLLLFEDKDHCGISFFKGVLLKDTKNLLYKQTENMQSDRQLRFTDINQLSNMNEVIKSYINEAKEIELSGITVELKKTEIYTVPEELKELLDSNSEFSKAFYKLTPGRQRGYLLHFSSPKQSKTRYSRIERSMDRILNGKGLNDCICGLSKRMPNCDGSHKELYKK